MGGNNADQSNACQHGTKKRIESQIKGIYYKTLFKNKN